MEGALVLILLLFIGASIFVIAGTFNSFSGFSEMRHRLGGVEDRQRTIIRRIDGMIVQFAAPDDPSPERKRKPEKIEPITPRPPATPWVEPSSVEKVTEVESSPEVVPETSDVAKEEPTPQETPSAPVTAEVVEPTTEPYADSQLRPEESIMVDPPARQADIPLKQTPVALPPQHPAEDVPSNRAAACAGSIRAASVAATVAEDVPYQPVPQATTPTTSTGRLMAQARKNPWSIRAQIMLRKAWNWTLYGQTRRPRETSVEFAVAANWLLRIGILILVTSLGFFLKYSIDNGYLGPAGRILMVTVLGLGGTAFGCKLLNKKYDLLGQGLIGAGIAALYFAIFAAFNMFHMIAQYPAFALMICITSLACGIAICFNRMLIAVLGTLGGLATPIMLSTGTCNFLGLYGYLTVLGAGVILISARRRWYTLYLLGFVGIYGISFLSLESFIAGDVEMFWQVFPFWIGYYLLFSAGGYLYSIVNRRQSNTLDIVLMLVNAALVYVVGLSLLRATFEGHASYDNFKAMMTLGLAAHNILLVFLFQFRRLRDKALSTTAIALAAFFLAITMPLVLSENWITASWAIEALVLLWVGERIRSTTLRYLAGIAYIFVFLKVGIVELPGHYSKPIVEGLTFAQYWPVMVERLMIFLVPILSLFGAAWVIGRSNIEAGTALDHSKRFEPEDLSPLGWVTLTLATFASGLIFLVLQLEFHRSFGYLAPVMRLPMLTILWVALVGVLIGLYRRYNTPLLEGAIAVVVGIILIKLFFVDLISPELRLTNVYQWDAGLMRMFDFGSTILMLAVGYMIFTRKGSERWTYARVLFGWPAFGLLFLYSSLELDAILKAFEPGLRYGGLSILWSIYALIMVVTGILSDQRARRLLGLALFAVVSFKVYFVDLSDLANFYRVVALFVLSLIIISGSFAYLKYRELIIPKKKEEEPAKIDTHNTPTLSA